MEYVTQARLPTNKSPNNAFANPQGFHSSTFFSDSQIEKRRLWFFEICWKICPCVNVIGILQLLTCEIFFFCSKINLVFNFKTHNVINIVEGSSGTTTIQHKNCMCHTFIKIEPKLHFQTHQKTPSRATLIRIRAWINQRSNRSYVLFAPTGIPKGQSQNTIWRIGWGLTHWTVDWMVLQFVHSQVGVVIHHLRLGPLR